MEHIFNKLKQLSNMNSDINEHLYTLQKYASQCEHITEMGTRYVVSTWALLAGKPKKLICYDILTNLNEGIVNKNLKEISEQSVSIGTTFEFHKKNVLDVEIEFTDMLFIDTYHEYNQLKSELRLHANKVKKYIILHDTTTYGVYGETFKEPNTIGIWPAIEEFLLNESEWYIYEKFENNNGLTVLKRK